MDLLRDIPIKRKLTRIIMLTSVVVLILNSLSFVLYEGFVYPQELVATMGVRASILADSIAGSVHFDIQEEAAETLAALRTDPHTIEACVYRNGEVLAGYPPDINLRAFPPPPGLSGHRFEPGALLIYQPVVYREKQVGLLYMKISLQPMYVRFQLYGVITAVVLVFSLFVAYLLSRSLQERVSKPILQLAETARTVSEGRDYSVRAQAYDRDEVGFLTEAFNLMLGQIQERDAALRENQERLRVALLVAEMGAWSTDPKTGLDTRDASFNRMLGRDPIETTEPLTSYLERIHPDDRERVANAFPRALERGAAFNEEYRVARPDGSIRWLRDRGRILRDSAGNLLHMTGAAVDMTDRVAAEQALRDSEERYRSLVASITSIVWTADARGGFASPQPAWEAYTGQGWSRHAGWGWLDAIHPDDRERIRHQWQRSLLHGAVYESEGRIWHEASRRHRYFVTRAVPLRNKDETIREWIGTIMDVDDRMQAENEVRRLNAELENRVIERTAELADTNRELEAFTYSVSHDLRAPLRHIDAYAQMLQEQNLLNPAPEASQYLQRIRRGAQNLGRLVDDLLNFSRLGRSELSRQPVSLGPVVEEVIASLKPEMADRAIEWVVRDLPVLECDPALMRQVFVNLLSNAIKYTRPREHAVIEIGQMTTGGKPVVYVRDNGVGFNMKYKHKLFGVFQRLHRAEDFEGTGVGLATVQRIIQKHGGQIWAESEVDRGATFYFKL